MAGDVGLERKLMQHRFAKGMYGLDLESAGRFQRAGEELSGKLELIGFRRLALDRLDFLCQLDIGQRGPAAQIRENAVLHVGGGRLGVGQAKDL
jgi:hypothetical protein